MKKESFILILIIFVIVVFCFIKFGFQEKSREENELEEQNTIEEIENEGYYIEKQKEFIDAEDEYEEILTSYIAEKFSEEDKNVLQEYNDKMTEAVQNGNKEEKLKLSHEKTEYIKKISEQKFTKEQLKKLEEIQKRKDELEPIVDEYMEKKAEIEEKKFNEGRTTLEDGTILNEREDVTGDKECNGLKFSNISLKYVPTEKCSKFSATVTNTSKEVKEGKVSVKITGDVETIFPLNIERLEPRENYSFEIENFEDISMANTLEIIEYNEKDYEK